ncbi:MAG: deoxyribose-phosphate aldolase [Lachnospiraceae bacterium]|nr:deoxyribose-phosphate aldolase [Lachnospiraceae bacterium]
MEKEKILRHLDHTLLKQDATWEQIRKLCDEGIKYEVASVCIPPCYVREAKDYVGDKLKICTVIGFPNGNHTTAAKVAETLDAVENGADEIDMVVNINRIKDDRFEEVYEDVKEVRRVCSGKILKVIIETCLLTQEEKIKMCHVVTKAKADYIKTSTGFSTGGATLEDVALLQKHIGDGVKVKAAGGISTIEDADSFLRIGADRLGTSRLIALYEGMGDKQV